MRFLFLNLTLLLSFSLQASPAKLIGTTAFSDKVFSRVLDSNGPEKTWTLMDLYFFTNPPTSFVEQLGYYDAASFEIKNGDPNSYNMILLGVLVDNISQAIADSCSTTANGPQLLTSLKSSVDKLCAWPALSAVDENVLTEFFHKITLFDYSFEEKQAWLSHFQNPEYLNKSASDVLYEMSFTLMLNPHYLLKK